jgi:hypothetical protein
MPAAFGEALDFAPLFAPPLKVERLEGVSAGRIVSARGEATLPLRPLTQTSE